MEDLIKLKSRDGIENYLKKLIKKDSSKSLTYVFKTDVLYLRISEVDNRIKFINPSDRPMIIVDNYLEEAKAVVKSIDFVEGYGWTITFE